MLQTEFLGNGYTVRGSGDVLGYLKSIKKTRGVGLQLDAVGWCIVVLIIAAIIITGLFSLRESAKVSSTQLELMELQTAVLKYEGIRIDGKPPTTLEDLLADPSISASDSIDGLDHGAFLPTENTRWANGKVTDLWGVAYEYKTNSDGTGSITSVGSGKQRIVKNF